MEGNKSNAGEKPKEKAAAERYDPKEAEPRWQKLWEEKGVYKFSPKSKAEIYSVDTPPPTISGKMHLGHSFSYSQQDFIVRFQRMRGKSVFYPFGTDNNGVATERLVEKMKGIKAKNMDRDKFVSICLETVNKELKPKYVEDMRSIGLSCDFGLFYDTIDRHSMKTSQKSFIDLFKKGREYRKDAPTMWCPACETGISQVECQDQELDSFFNDIVFKAILDSGNEEDLVVATTRPELLPACVAVFYHPDDKRYKKYHGKNAKVPLFNFEVPILPDERADPEKGTGIVMCCTFGDQTDMEWQKAYNLPIKEAIAKDGRMTSLAGKYEGIKIAEARKAIINDMKDAGLLLSQKKIKHAVNVHERCGTEIEFLKSKQWFIKYLDLKEDMLRWGKELNWHPQHMKSRYDHWVKGLQWDWMISRQRYFGVPFPVWYCRKCDETILADEKSLPVDPIKDKPPVNECPKCGSTEFIPEKDVMDTWATSSLTPQIAAGLVPEMYDKIYPMSLRPQAHDIITFWLFNTVVKSRLHNGISPWKDVVISGHAQDPHGRKMSKSKGNVVEPQAMVEKYCADALRFWAAGSKLGDDLPFQEKDLVTGQKTITKLFNAARFAAMHLEGFDPAKHEDIELEAYDSAVLSKMNTMVKECTEHFENYEYSRTKSEADKFFWKNICDLYLEVVKDRIYNPDKRGENGKKSGQMALYRLMLTTIKLLAPIMPHITEEIYQKYFKETDGAESVHTSKWPEFDKSIDNKDAEILGSIVDLAVEKVRKAKSEKSVSLKEPVKKVVVSAAITQEQFDSIKDDIKGVTHAEDAVLEIVKEGAEISCSVDI